MEIIFIINRKKYITTIKNEKSFICQLLSEENENKISIFDVDSNDFYMAFKDDVLNKENVLLALNYVFNVDIIQSQFELYNTINGLEFLGILEENIKIFNMLKNIYWSLKTYFSPYISSEIMRHFGTYETLRMISCGLLLNYEGKLNVDDEKITQELLDNCSHCLPITKLINCRNPNVNNVDFCAETLQELWAYYKCKMDQKGIEKATKLRVLCIMDNKNVTNIDFCAETLEELDVSFSDFDFDKKKEANSCKINQLGIEKATKLKKLNAAGNSKVNDIGFCAETLEELRASWLCGIDQNGIEKANKLKSLAALGNNKIISVDFCAETLEELDASYTCGIDQNGIEKATKLIKLIVNDNMKIKDLYFCTETLQELFLGYSCDIEQNGIKNCTKLKKLAASDNPKITNVDFCAKTLEELDASYDCGIDQESIEKCTKLKKLNYKYNKKITKFPL